MSSTTVSLQAVAGAANERKPLSHLIARINEQRGSFRNVTEESLEEELENGQDDEAVETEDMQDEAEDALEVEDEKAKRERLLKARGEMIKSVGYES